MYCQLRSAVLSDLPAIYSFERAYIREIEPQQELLWTEAVPRHLEQWIVHLTRMFVAVQNDEIVGHCFWQPEDGRAVLYVVPAWRRHGLGTLLLRRFEEDARAQGCSRLALSVRENNPARHLYAQEGYRVTHVYDGSLFYEKAERVHRTGDRLQIG